MDIIYNKKYFENYDTAEGKTKYNEAEDLKLHMINTAKNIKDTINPKTVLDAGCATGHLVAALRDLGIEAYGIDISEYAINSVRDDIKKYCFVASLEGNWPDELPTQFDLITNIEVIEHLREKQGLKALENFTKHSDYVLFSSTPDDIEDPTHLNVQLQEYWAEKFANLSFYNKVDFDADFLSEQAVLFYKNDKVPIIVSDYERKLRLDGYNKKTHIEKILNLENRNLNLEERSFLINSLLKEKESSIQEKSDLINKLNIKTKNLQTKNVHIGRNVENLQASLHNFETSFFWKITKPFRWLLDKLKLFFKNFFITKKIYKFLLHLKYTGLKPTLEKTRHYLKKKTNLTIKKFYLSKNEYKSQQNIKFTKNIKFSIVVPLYNPPIKFLKELMESVLNQTYSNWELCLADGGSSDKIKKYCENLVVKNEKIKYSFLNENKGISGNTNAALAMATGDYIALLDHDDMLHPSALYENMMVIENIDADFIYSDEVTFNSKTKKIITEHYKPDFAIDNLRANNYICHLTVFKKDLLENSGMLRPDFDGSQDHDFIFRLTENSKNIYHIQKNLYFWRSHPKSVAQDINSKTYAIKAGKKSVLSHLERQGLNGEVRSTRAFPTIYEIDYILNKNPLISIIIPNKDQLDHLKKCIESIYNKTTYSNYEIIIVDNNSEDEDLFEYYKLLEFEKTNIKILKYNKPFNYSKINNFAIKYSLGEYLLLLNNDTEVITYEWIEKLLMYAQRKDVGAVGAKLYFPDNTIQHAGIVLGLGADRAAGHVFYGVDAQNLGYMGRLEYAQNYTAVTGACLMVSKEKYNEVNGLDKSFGTSYNDVDFCLKLREKGYLNIFTPFAKLYHYESKIRGYEDSLEKKERFFKEKEFFKNKWREELKKGDPYFNPNFSLDVLTFEIK